DAVKTPQGVRMGATATTKINRQDFGVTWSRKMDGGGVVVSDEVDITIDIEMTGK
ncbi:MAG: YceI family protein, partial [Bryobacteraceae bacterium]|nr:YceI family protein [Bryobacteraceae bacterium]